MEKTIFDHHVHSEFSEDSIQSYESLVQAAIVAGKSAFVTTEHYEPINEQTGFFCVDILYYQEVVKKMQAKYPQIRLLRGIEIGYERQTVARIQQIIDSAEFEIIIISIHTLLGGNDVAGTYKKYGYWPFGEDPVAQYFEAAIDAIERLDGFQILGHLDYVLRYVDRSEFKVMKYQSLLTTFFEKLIAKQIALDINTSGWRYGLGYAHPQPEILALYRSLGGKLLCLGSDAHKIEDVNAEFATTLQMLQNLGFTEITSYATGSAEQIRIGDILHNQR